MHWGGLWLGLRLQDGLQEVVSGLRRKVLIDETDPVVSKNTNELKTRVSQGASDRRVYARFAKGS